MVLVRIDNDDHGWYSVNRLPDRTVIDQRHSDGPLLVRGRADLRPRGEWVIVRPGVGGFHRAHQVVYLDDPQANDNCGASHEDIYLDYRSFVLVG